jgi:hypothetical protein
VVEPRLGPHRLGVDPVPEVEAVLGRDRPLERLGPVDDAEDGPVRLHGDHQRGGEDEVHRPAAADRVGEGGGQPEGEGRPVLATADDERRAVDERPDAPVLTQEEPDAAEAPRGERHERAAVDEGVVVGAPAHRRREEAVEAVALQLRAGAPAAVDEEHGALAVEDERAALGAPEPLRGTGR